MTTSLIEVNGLSKSYWSGARELKVISDLDLSVRPGEMVAIVGSSGVGKSTLLQLIGGLDQADQGMVRIGDTRITSLDDAELVGFRNSHIGFVFQFHHLLPEFSALENVGMPLRIAGVTETECRERAELLLEQVGLAARLQHKPGTLSGGEQQRVAVARALVMTPTLLLADEPTGDLDEQSGDAIQHLIRDVHKAYGLTSVIATHNMALAASCDRVWQLANGRLQETSRS